jgi:hypothetical protein
LLHLLQIFRQLLLLADVSATAAACGMSKLKLVLTQLSMQDANTHVSHSAAVAAAVTAAATAAATAAVAVAAAVRVKQTF